ncbi:MAG: NAD(P)H-dependent oxidoreductase subunit E, partial [Bacilli bacterium]|nr:NAD(P)H-dependent oxidoreductase subunit E [Bacilli bacterium]
MEEEKKLEGEKRAKFQELADFIASKNADPHELIAVLHKAQAIFGYLPEEVQRFVAVKLGIPVAKVYSVVSFYSFFTMKKSGK